MDSGEGCVAILILAAILVGIVAVIFIVLPLIAIILLTLTVVGGVSGGIYALSSYFQALREAHKNEEQ